MNNIHSDEFFVNPYLSWHGKSGKLHVNGFNLLGVQDPVISDSVSINDSNLKEIHLISSVIIPITNKSLPECTPPPANYKGNYFDLKLSRYTLDYWDPFIPPVITRWTTAQISVTEQIGTDVRRLFKSTWPHDGATYKVKDTSALPMGLTLESSGLLTGIVTHEEVGETIIECYIDRVLNHTTKLVYDIMVSA